jgi:cell division protein FtsI/penicillin-binding protein 2
VGPVVRTRLRLLCAGVLALACGIALRLAFLQLVDADWLRSRAQGQRWREIEVPATRGAIFDREGRELAVSLHTESLFAHPWRVREPGRVARLLAPVIGIGERKLIEQLGSSKSFEYLHRFLEPEQARAVRELDLPLGDNKPLGFLPSAKRYYPHGRLAVHALGFANVDGVGLDGVEHELDSVLRGAPLRYLVLRDGQNGCLRRTRVGQARPPHDVQLTLDLVLQHVVERQLDLALESSGARAASGLLLDPATGQVLALANRPTVDANHYGQAHPEARVDRAVVRQYEPGSTFKAVTMAVAIERGQVRPEQRFDCENGSWVHHERRIRDSSPLGVITATEILEKSSNIGMAKIIRPLAPEALRESILRFGFGSRTGIELPGELPGVVPAVAEWSAQSQASLAFGHEIGVTALQMASALATLAHDGVRIAPRLVLGTIDPQGRTHERPQPAPERVVSSATARVLASMLEGAVVRGTGKAARLQGYRIAGKTGTAQKIVDGRYSESEFMASFAAYGPVSAPRLVALVVLDTPHGPRHMGGQVAAPPVGHILEEGLRYLRVPYDEALPARPQDRSSAQRRAPARRPPPVTLPAGGAPGPGLLPDLRGLSAREAIVALASRGCRPRIEGRGIVVEQDPPGGAPVSAGGPCRVRLGEPAELDQALLASDGSTRAGRPAGAGAAR